MGLRLEPITTDDAVRMNQITKSAFSSTPIDRVLFPGPFPENSDESAEDRAEGMKKKLGYPCVRAVKVVDEELEAQGVESRVAIGIWYIWEDAVTEDKMPPAAPPGPGSNPQAFAYFFGGLRSGFLERYSGKPVVFLSMLATDPAHHRRGAGGMIMKWGAGEADRLGIPAYLEATEAGEPLYQKYGFAKDGTFTMPLDKFGGEGNGYLSLMERPAPAK